MRNHRVIFINYCCTCPCDGLEVRALPWAGSTRQDPKNLETSQLPECSGADSGAGIKGTMRGRRAADGSLGAQV